MYHRLKCSLFIISISMGTAKLERQKYFRNLIPCNCRNLLIAMIITIYSNIKWKVKAKGFMQLWLNEIPHNYRDRRTWTVHLFRNSPQFNRFVRISHENPPLNCRNRLQVTCNFPIRKYATIFFILTGHHHGHLSSVDHEQHRSVEVDVVPNDSCRQGAHIQIQVPEDTANHSVGY